MREIYCRLDEKDMKRTGEYILGHAEQFKGSKSRQIRQLYKLLTDTVVNGNTEEMRMDFVQKKKARKQRSGRQDINIGQRKENRQMRAEDKRKEKKLKRKELRRKDEIKRKKRIRRQKTD
jgi:hypothetical protein